MEQRTKLWLMITTLIGLSALLIDTQLSLFAASIRGFIPDFFLLGFTFKIQTFLVLFVLTSLFLFQENKRRWITPLWLTAICAALISYLLKIAIQRARPFEAGVVGVLAIAFNMLGESMYTWNFSFPSFQAVLAFSAMPILSKEFKKIKWVWFAIACIIAFSRVYFGLHYASDVILGAALGYLIGSLVVDLELKHKFGTRINKKIKSIKDKLIG